MAWPALALLWGNYVTSPKVMGYTYLKSGPVVLSAVSCVCLHVCVDLYNNSYKQTSLYTIREMFVCLSLTLC